MAKKRRRGRIKFAQRAQLVRKGDKKRTDLPQAPTRLAGDNGANFRIKIRRKQ